MTNHEQHAHDDLMASTRREMGDVVDDAPTEYMHAHKRDEQWRSKASPSS